MSEAAISRSIIEWINTHGGHAIKLAANHRQGAGEPDILATYHGRSVAIETKQPGETPRAVQRWALLRWANAGAIVIVAESLQDVTTILERETRHG